MTEQMEYSIELTQLDVDGNTVYRVDRITAPVPADLPYDYGAAAPWAYKDGSTLRIMFMDEDAAPFPMPANYTIREGFYIDEDGYKDVSEKIKQCAERLTTIRAQIGSATETGKAIIEA